MIPDKYKDLFVGPNKYTIGLIYVLANLMGYFTHMRKQNITDTNSMMILFVIIMIAKILT